MDENKNTQTACKNFFKNGNSITKEQFTNVYIQMALQLEKTGGLTAPSQEKNPR